ncbi:hypothetical protein MAM1_0033d02537 [Mucor ambiguus]|uniref:Uncharacterized protein n=1 Tax=Mucor ambiguus TaxID=91626 RepID=A0A0C9M2Q3_9FUNG|nr:hypothetical protein MAM1_0033d02537 [Mucor ambiguus]
MQKSFISIALLLVAFLFSVTQIAAASVETQNDNAEVKKASFPVYDIYRSMYDQYYNRWAAHAMRMNRETEPAQFPPFPPFPPPPTFPPFPPFPPHVNTLAERDVGAEQFPPFPPFPPPPTFPPFPPFPPRS